MGVPAQAKAFFGVAPQLRLGCHSAGWQAAVLSSVKNQYLAVDAHRCNNIWVLRLVSRFIDLSRVVDLLLDRHLDGRRLARR